MPLERCRLNHTHFKGIFDLHRRFDPTCEILSLDHFVVYLYKIEGWVVLDGEKVVAAVYVDQYLPRCNIILHCVSDPEYRTKWVNRRLLKDVFNFTYNTLGLERVSGYVVSGMTDDVGKSLVHLGFTKEGTNRKAAFIKGEHRDVEIYGMLKEECRWIR